MWAPHLPSDQGQQLKASFRISVVSYDDTSLVLTLNVKGCGVDKDRPISWRTLQQIDPSMFYDLLILWSSTVRLLWLYFLRMLVNATMPATGAPAWAQCIPRSCCLWNSLKLHIKFGRVIDVTWYLPVPSAWCCTKVQDQIAGLHLATTFWSCFVLCCSICSTKP